MGGVCGHIMCHAKKMTHSRSSTDRRPCCMEAFGVRVLFLLTCSVQFGSRLQYVSSRCDLLAAPTSCILCPFLASHSGSRRCVCSAVCHLSLRRTGTAVQL